MATNAIIGTFTFGGKITSTTVHWDGDTIGPILATHYNTPELATSLIEHGSISSLGVRIDALTCHTFDEREEGTTTFYHRDRGDQLSFNVFNDFDAFEEWLLNGSYARHVYYFDGVQWNVLTIEQGVICSKFIELDPVEV
jgi:hypothetical protein